VLMLSCRCLRYIGAVSLFIDHYKWIQCLLQETGNTVWRPARVPGHQSVIYHRAQLRQPR